MKNFRLLFLAGVFFSMPAFPQDDLSLYEPFLSTDAIGAAQFLKNNPQADGRGVLIAVLDTGGNMGVAGLKTASTGEAKVIEARDFSGQGEIKLNYSDLSDGTLRSENRWVKGVDKLPVKPSDGKYFVGFLEETKFRNSYVKDINGNGKLEDVFAVVVFKVKNEQGEDFAAFVDRDGDGDISDEQQVYDYGKKQQPFTFEGHDPQRMQAPMHCALNIEEGGRKVSIHTPDGSHGTHVAGIAAGFGINGKAGFNGIAPGAKILSLKIGDNTLSGGATTSESKKKALEYAAQYAREKGVFVVVNMSYGVGSEIEGKSDIDKLADRLAVENPHLFMAFSAGNQGPGLSSVGTPAAALHIFAAGP
ncbi:MAG: S8 family serine peptidase, partial [Deltaproteobacteria bacterium]|nr:S8 family serine peptidase [Deltaproteobacteria bacterium]